MPGIPLVARETTCSAGAAEQMCRQDSLVVVSPVQLSAEEEAAAEKSLALYCKPVELYNIIQTRAAKNPSYLHRCMKYKLEAKQKRRIQLTLSLHLSVDHGLQIQSIFPLYMMVARPASTFSTAEHSVRYHFKRCITLSTCAGGEGTSRGKAKFFLPESNELSAEMKCSSLAILFISCAEPGVDHMDFASFQRQGGQCMLGKIPMELLDLSCGRSPNSREGSVSMLTVDLHPCVIMANCVDANKCVSFQKAPTPAIMASMQRLEVIFTAEEIEAKSPCNSHSSGDIPSSSLSQLTRLNMGIVVFNYKYYNGKLQQNEVTTDYSCPFCLVKCGSFKGLECHMHSSHDRFDFVFLSDEAYEAVNVSVRTETWKSENFADKVESLKESYSFCANRRRRRKPMRTLPSRNHVHPLLLESDFPMETDELRDGIDTTIPHANISAFSLEYVEHVAPNQDTTRVSPEAAPSVVPTGTLPLPGRSRRSQDTTRVSPARAPSVDPTSALSLPGRSQDTTRVSPARAPSVHPTSALSLPGRSQDTTRVSPATTSSINPTSTLPLLRRRQDTTRVSPATAPSVDPTSALSLPGRSQDTARVSSATTSSVDPTNTLPLLRRRQDTTRVSLATAPSVDLTSALSLPGRSQDTTRVSPATTPSVDPTTTLSLPGRSQDTTRVSPATTSFVDPTSTLPVLRRRHDTTRVSPTEAPSVDPTNALTLPGSSIITVTTPQIAKHRKLSVERSDPKNNDLLLKRQFFHSHPAQPMAMEQVLSGYDSEGERDDEVADLEEQRMLYDFVDVTKDEKKIMLMWNSFVRRQRVRADGHIPWACEHFSRLHAESLVQTPSLLRCWKILMMKLWNQCLVDPHTIDKCGKICNQLQ